MSELSKQALKVDNNQSFPNNNTGYITPSRLRDFNVNMIDSLVDEQTFNSFSQSVTQSIEALQNFSSSLDTNFASQTEFNTFTASTNTKINNLSAQTASYATSAITASSLVTASFNNGTRNLTFTKGDATTFNVNIPDVSGSAGDFVTTSSFNSYTASTDSSISQLNASTASQQTSINALNTNSASVNTSITNVNSATASLFTDVNNLNSTTASLNTSASLALVTASFSGNTLTFTKGNGTTFGVVIPDVSGSTGNFATTGSNTFTGTQTINADAYVSGTADLGFVTIRDNGGINLMTTGSGPVTSYGIVTNPSNGDLVFNNNPGNGRLMTFNQTDGIMNLFNGMKLDTSFIGIDVFDHPLNLSSSFGGMTTMLTAQGNVVVSGSMITSGSAVVTGSLRVTGSISTTGSVDITGPLNLGGVQTINYVSSGVGQGEVYLLADSGSLVIGNSASTPTYAALSHISSSVPNANTNLIFKTNTNTADTIISSSANIFVNPQSPIAGFKRYLTGANIAIGGLGAAVPQVTGSLNFSPIIANNYFGVSATPLLYRGPVSSSAVAINNNVFAGGQVLFGANTGSNFERAVSGLAFNNNVINSSGITLIAAKTTLSSSVGIVNSNIGGVLTLNMDSSSIQMFGSIVQGNLTVNNSYHPSTYNSNTAILSVNSFINIGTNTIYASGSNATFPGNRSLANTGIIGNGNVISASLNGDNAQINSTTLLGQGLTAVGTNTRQVAALMSDYGTVFVGRLNAIDGTKNQTAETVFAVGTGTSGSAGIARKTGFLIDSGSNSFFEGTLNVSGSTTLSGSLYIQSASAFPTQIGTSLVTWDATTGQIGQATTTTLISSSFSAGEFYSTTTLSGSSGVSASIELPNTAISNGVSIQSNSQIVVQNTGVYNIQFSAQADAFDGADTIWIWFKKNGTNIADSASKLIMQNNTAAIMTVNIFDNAVPNDYFEVVWQNNAGVGKLISDAATGNIPGIPSIIVTVNQVK
jgi:hypothetical protein